MSTKKQNLEQPSSCLNKAEDDEPIFVLRANDPIAPMAVRIWASLSEQMVVHSKAKTTLAWQEAIAMEAWREKLYGAPRHDWGSLMREREREELSG